MNSEVLILKRKEPIMTVSILMIIYSSILLSISITPLCIWKDAYASEQPAKVSVKADRELISQIDSRPETNQTIEEYEKEKLARLKRYIGRRFIAVKTSQPAVFYESPDRLEKIVRLKEEKEGFLIMGVVQDRSGTMYFYQVRFDSGKMGYLPADAYYLEYRIKEGSILPVTKGVSAKRLTEKEKLRQSKELASKAVELVKNHPILIDPMSGEWKSVEKRMMDKRASSSPNLKWRYEAKEVGNNKYRVDQYSEGEMRSPIVRTWIVDLSTGEVNPENLAAKRLYR
jgi:hypothetical protein